MICPRLAAFLLTGALAHAAFAQDVLLYRANQAVDAREVARILGGASAEDEPIRTRGFRLLEPAQRAEPRRPRVAAGQPEQKDPTALALPVQFAFDSAHIQPAAKPQLDALAEGIKLLSADQQVVIEGHTDAAGTEDYNLGLSERRAASVKQYLVDTHGIDGARLQAVGRGKLQPLGGRDPRAVENRRVQFHGA